MLTKDKRKKIEWFLNNSIAAPRLAKDIIQELLDHIDQLGTVKTYDPINELQSMSGKLLRVRIALSAELYPSDKEKEAQDHLAKAQIFIDWAKSSLEDDKDANSADSR